MAAQISNCTLRKNRHRYAGALFVPACIVMAFVVPLLALPYYAIDGDEPYQALACLNYRISPFAPLTYFIGNLWMSLFGKTMMSLRVLQLVCQSAAVALGVAYFYYKTRNTRLSAFLFMVLTIGMQMFTVQLYNWDSGSYFFVEICALATIAYWNNPGMLRAAATGFTAVLMIASRIPDAAILPLLLAVLVTRRHRTPNKLFAELAIGVISLLVTALAIVFIIYGSIDTLIMAWRPENIITGHGVDGEFGCYVWRLFHTIPRTCIYMLIGWAAITLGIATARIKAGRTTVYIIMCVTLAVVTALISKYMDTQVLYGMGTIYLAVVLLAPLFKCLYDGDESIRLNGVGWILIAFAIVPVTGSDGYLERIFAGPLIPIALTLCMADVKKYIVPVGIYTMAVLMSVWGYFFLASRFRDYRDLGELSPQYAGCMVQPYWYDVLSSVKTDVDKLTAENMPYTVMGVGNYMIEWAFPNNSIAVLHHFHWLNYDMEREYIDSIFEDPCRYKALLYKYEVYFRGSEQELRFEQYLRDHGFREMAERKHHHLWVRDNE